MLVLTRRASQSFRIGDFIVITIERIKGEQVHIGIKAPKEIPIFREESYLEALLQKTQHPGTKSK